MTRKKPDVITIIAQTHSGKLLKDFRIGRNSSVFGNILDVARQYGIKTRLVDDGIECKAPKSRMQMFVEKLHFSTIPYIEIV